MLANNANALFTLFSSVIGIGIADIRDGMSIQNITVSLGA